MKRHGHGACVLALAAAAMVVDAVPIATAGGARPEPVACFDPRAIASDAAEPIFGPCASPDPVGYFPAVAGAPALVMTNFGFLEPATGDRWQYICDDAFGRPAADRVRRSPNGDVLIPTAEGLLVTRDGCTFEPATGDIAGRTVFDVAVDAKDPSVVFALGDTPRKLWRSGDGGRRFTTAHTFPDGLFLQRVVVPPTRNKEVYVVGRGRDTATPLGASTDDGATFTMRDPGTNAGAALTTVLEYLAADPVAPNVLYFSVVVPDGDQLWRSSDGGATASRVLTLLDGEALTGMAFGPTPTTWYVAGKTVFLEPGRPRGRLYISRDAGTSWLPPVLSEEKKGPQFNCLVAAGNQLFACGVPIGDPTQFLVGVSNDEGKTWAPVTGLPSLKGPKQCIADQCQTVARWLCDYYSSCPDGVVPTPNPALDAGPVNDAGANRSPVDASAGGTRAPQARKGGGCTVGSASNSPAAATLIALLAAVSAGRIRRRRARRAG